jgi:FeS assembly protein IscX
MSGVGCAFVRLIQLGRNTKEQSHQKQADGYNRAEFHMQDPVYWDDAYPIALLLRAAHPDVADPSLVETGVLHAWVIALDAFADDRAIMPAEWLAQILVEWVELI